PRDNNPYAHHIGCESRAKSAGNLQLDDFMRRKLEHAYAAASEGRHHTGPVMQMGSGKESHTVTLVSSPIMVEDRFIGMIGVIVDQQPLLNRLRDDSKGGLSIYVVDGQGRLVAGTDPSYATGQD